MTEEITNIRDLAKEGFWNFYNGELILEILLDPASFNMPLNSEPPIDPQDGDLYLYNSAIVTDYKRDGVEYSKKKDILRVQEVHQEISIDEAHRITGYYSTALDKSLIRRCYRRMEKDSNIFLVHYRKNKEKLKRLERIVTNKNGIRNVTILKPLIAIKQEKKQGSNKKSIKKGTLLEKGVTVKKEEKKVEKVIKEEKQEKQVKNELLQERCTCEKSSSHFEHTEEEENDDSQISSDFASLEMSNTNQKICDYCLSRNEIINPPSSSSLSTPSSSSPSTQQILNKKSNNTVTNSTNENLTMIINDDKFFAYNDSLDISDDVDLLNYFDDEEEDDEDGNSIGNPKELFPLNYLEENSANDSTNNIDQNTKNKHNKTIISTPTTKPITTSSSSNNTPNTTSNDAFSPESLEKAIAFNNNSENSFKWNVAEENSDSCGFDNPYDSLYDIKTTPTKLFDNNISEDNDKSNYIDNDSHKNNDQNSNEKTGNKVKNEAKSSEAVGINSPSFNFFPKRNQSNRPVSVKKEI